MALNWMVDVCVLITPSRSDLTLLLRGFTWVGPPDRGMNGKVEKVEAKVEKVEEKVEKVEAKVEKVEAKVVIGTGIGTEIGTGMSAAMTVGMGGATTAAEAMVRLPCHIRVL